MRIPYLGGALPKTRIAMKSACQATEIRCEPFQGTLDAWDGVLQAFPDHEIFQTSAWIRFLAESQGGEPVLAVLKSRNEIVGYFAGLVVRKLGVRILGSPFIGWTTERMGLRLRPDVSRRPAIKALLDYAFCELGCLHMEFADPQINQGDVVGLGFRTSVFKGSLVDLTLDEDQLYHSFKSSSCRYCIRKGTKLGVVVEEANDDGFADDYYEQLKDVFAKQSLVPTYGKARVQSLIRHLMPTGNLLLLRAREPQGRCIATGIFLGMNRIAYFWGNASWRQDQHFCPNELLQWHSMRHWKNRGMERYDFCGGGEYKKKYGGELFERLLFRKSKYRWLILARELARRSYAVYQHLAGLF